LTHRCTVPQRKLCMHISKTASTGKWISRDGTLTLRLICFGVKHSAGSGSSSHPLASLWVVFFSLEHSLNEMSSCACWFQSLYLRAFCNDILTFRTMSAPRSRRRTEMLDSEYAPISAGARASRTCCGKDVSFQSQEMLPSTERHDIVGDFEGRAFQEKEIFEDVLQMVEIDRIEDISHEARSEGSWTTENGLVAIHTNPTGYNAGRKYCFQVRRG